MIHLRQDDLEYDNILLNMFEHNKTKVVTMSYLRCNWVDPQLQRIAAYSNAGWVLLYRGSI